MINTLLFFALLMILHYSFPNLKDNNNALSLLFFSNANTLVELRHTQTHMTFSAFFAQFVMTYREGGTLHSSGTIA